MFWSLRRRDRVFVVAGGATSFDGKPLPTEQSSVGRPFLLGAFEPGQFRGDHFAVVTAGYLRGVGRLPDFLGGPIFIGDGSRTARPSTTSTPRSFAAMAASARFSTR